MITDDDRADNLVFVEDGLDKALSHQFGAGNDIGAVLGFDNLYFEAFALRALLRIADTGNLRMTVNDGGYGIFVVIIFTAAV